MTVLPATSTTGPLAPRILRRDVPVLVFRLVTAVLATFVLTGPGGARNLLNPWVTGTGAHVEMHRWHATDLPALVSLLVVGVLVVCIIAPRRHIVAGQAFLAAVASLGLLSLTMPDASAALAPSVALAVVFVAAHPRRRALVQWQGQDERNLVAVTAAVVGTPFLLSNAWTNLGQQLTDTSEHAALGHWAGAAALAMALLLVGWLAAAGAPGSRPLAVVLGVTWLYLGAAALRLPAHDGSWKPVGAVVALVAGGLFLAVPFAADRAGRWGNAG